MEKETKEFLEFLVEVKNSIADLIEDGAVYFLVAMLYIFFATGIGVALYLLYLIHKEIIKFFLFLLLTTISICILFVLIALIKNFFDFISDKIKESRKINNEPNISNKKGEE